MLRLKCIFRFLDAHPKGYYFLQMLVDVVILQHVVRTCLRFWFLECKDQVESLRKSVTSLFTYRFQASIFLKVISRIWKATLSHLLYQQTFLLWLALMTLNLKKNTSLPPSFWLQRVCLASVLNPALPNTLLLGLFHNTMVNKPPLH